MKKVYYSISEAAQHAGLAPHVLRYWETVFPQLQPRKSKGGARLYQEHDLGQIRQIKHLLYEKGYTIKGAKRLLRQGMAYSPEPAPLNSEDVILETKQALRDILNLLG